MRRRPPTFPLFPTPPLSRPANPTRIGPYPHPAESASCGISPILDRESHSDGDAVGMAFAIQDRTDAATGRLGGMWVGPNPRGIGRSGERRGGEEGKCRGSPAHLKEKNKM